MVSLNKVFFNKNTTFTKIWKYIFLWINFILVSPVTPSVLRFSSLWGRDGMAICRGERVTKKFPLTQHCVLFALWCQCSTSCRRFAVCNIPDRERKNIKISSSNKRSRQLKTLVLFFLTVSKLQHFHYLNTRVECLLSIKPHCLHVRTDICYWESMCFRYFV